MTQIIVLSTFLILLLACTPSSKIRTITTQNYSIQVVDGIEEYTSHRSSGSLAKPFCRKDSFDTNSKILKTICFDGNYNVAFTIDYKYDNLGNQLTELTEAGEIWGITNEIRYTYDSSGASAKTIKDVYLGGTNHISKEVYDNEKRLIESYRYHDEIQFMKTLYFYDTKTKFNIKSESSSTNGTIRIIQNLYDENGKNIESKFFDNEKLSFTFKNKYEGDIKLQTDIFLDHESKPFESQFFDKFGNIIEIKRKQEHTNMQIIEEVYIYIYDKRNNWIERRGGNPSKKIIRKIDYY